MSIKPIKAGKNKWRVEVSMGNSGDGKRLRHIETITGRHPDAIRRRNELEVLRSKGVTTPAVRLTLGVHLKNWLEGYVKSRCSPRTIDSYESIAERHVIPNLGHYQLRQLSHQAIQEYYSKACETLSPRTVAKHHRLLSQALKYAVRQGYLVRNPCDLVDAPKWQPKPMRALTKGEAGLLLEAASSSPYYPVYYTAISTGLRQAELCGLRWRDISLDTCSISVNQALYKRSGVSKMVEPKTSHSRRRVAMTDKLAQFLREYRAERESFYLHLSQLLTLDSLVFSLVDKPCDPSMLSHDFAIIAKKAGIEGVRFHDLRHTFASLALERGLSTRLKTRLSRVSN
ncbi:Tyrosine recombinase XerC [subsurface metagenome]